MTDRMTMLGLAMLCWLAAAHASAGEFPDKWYYDRPEDHIKFEGVEAPALTVGEWIGDAFDPAKDMKGNIIVVDFWATWCQPCIAAMPKNAQLAKQYAGQGVKVIGVCMSGDPKQMPTILERQKATYPNAFTKGEQTGKDWPVQWYPTYAVIDRAGVVRAIGLTPEHVEDVVETLLQEDADASGRARIRPAWLEGDKEKRKRLKRLEESSDKPPALNVDDWQNTEPVKLDTLKGNVVVLDFWATWSGPSIRAIQRHNELIDKYGSKGLVFIGISATLGGEAAREIVKEHDIRYPVCVDVDNKTNAAYDPNGYPDYYLIDKAGSLRIADCANASLEDAIKALLAEDAEPEKDE